MPLKIDPQSLLHVCQASAGLSYRFRGVSTVIALPFLDPQLEVVFEEGRVMDVRPISDAKGLRIEGPDDYLKVFMGPETIAGYESLTMAMRAGVQVVGADQAMMHSFLGAFDYLLQVVRQAIQGSREVALDADYAFRDTDCAVGRYKYVTVDGVEARIYYEESGSGEIALMMQHTAGADGRQYRHILADPEMQKRFRLISYDLPFHGKSIPPTGTRWWEEAYRPTKESLMAWIVALSKALELDRPVFMGCSIGGNLALDLAAHHKDDFRAFIALNGWYCPQEGMDGINDPFRDPSLHPDMYASLCLGATSPLAPEAYRQEVYFTYRSNAPGVFAGDNDYFMFGHDLRKDGHLIDTNVAPVYHMVGEYDPAMHNDECGARAVVKHIPGVKFRIMEGLSHFAPSDDPMRFREELLPVLDEILERERKI